MDDVRLNYFSPVITGKPQPIQTHKPEKGLDKTVERENFSDLLAESLRKNSEVNFSKHAVKRAAQHNIELDEDSINRLNQGVKIASEKNLEEPLILVGNKAFLVNIPNNTVITAIDSTNTKGNVFTNIDGTVII